MINRKRKMVWHGKKFVKYSENYRKKAATCGHKDNRNNL